MSHNRAVCIWKLLLYFAVCLKWMGKQVGPRSVAACKVVARLSQALVVLYHPHIYSCICYLVVTSSVISPAVSVFCSFSLSLLTVGFLILCCPLEAKIGKYTHKQETENMRLGRRKINISFNTVTSPCPISFFKSIFYVSACCATTHYWFQLCVKKIK